jgi:hypothetical protein
MINIRLLVSGDLGSGSATLEVNQNKQKRRLLITATHDLHLNLGDSVKCLVGTAVAMINPGTQARTYILTTTPPLLNDGKHVTMLVLNAETTRLIQRGSISVTEDIGTVLRATSAVSR